ncbi:hypothetical protein SMALB_3643 [Streptomyces malaysiensis]|uniref:Uncharacterized protein n=1 Tax=Streptomyces malaysiensis TaxID=92644 RepID=A0A7X5X2V1_STRMQ|nr:hypothetical protein [Streptomyces malaysiensis]
MTYVAARRQTSDQGRVDHAHRLREERRSTYLAFLEAIEPVDNAVHSVDSEYVNNLLATGSPDWSAMEAVAEQVYDASRSLYRLSSRIQLAGPKGMADSADEIWVAVRELHTELVKIWDSKEIPSVDALEAGLWTCIAVFERRKREFTEGVRDVLETP